MQSTGHWKTKCMHYPIECGCYVWLNDTVVKLKAFDYVYGHSCNFYIQTCIYRFKNMWLHNNIVGHQDITVYPCVAAMQFDKEMATVVLCPFDWLWHSDATWRHIFRSALARANAMACCLMAPGHYLNKCWIIIREVLWHSTERIFTVKAQDIYLWYGSEND